MVLEKLGDALKDTLSKIKNSLTVDRNLVEEIIKEIQKSLLSADVNVKLVLDITKQIRDRAITERNENLSKKEHLITIIYEELTKFLGSKDEFKLDESKQNIILLVGLYGQGKTTTAGKLANYFKNRSKKVALLSTDTYRPAAYEQLKQYSKILNIDVFGDPSIKSAQTIYSNSKNSLKDYEVVIIDSAGRDSLNQELVTEISELNNLIKPTQTFLVMGADVGQTAQKQAESFKERLNITGVIITKMDGTGKGGGALSACACVNAPVRFIGTGEKIDNLEKFNSKRFVSQLLGMGDLESLLEKAQLAIDEEQARNLQERLMQGEFDLDDLYEQLKAMNKMGSMSKIINMIPGLSSLKIDKSQMQVQQDKMQKWKYIMDSMTKYEKRNPKDIDLSRIKRIAQGSGTDISHIRDLLKHYKQTKKMMTMFKDPSSMSDVEDMNPSEMMKMMKKSGMKNFKKFMKK